MSHYDSPSSFEHGADPFASGDTPLSSSGSEEPTPGDTAFIAPPRRSDSTPAVASEQARQVGLEAVESGKQVAAVATDEVKSVAAEAGTQARNLLGEARSQLTEQASTQQNNIAAWLQSLVEELDQMIARSEESHVSGGTATTLVQQVADRARSTAGWLETHEPADLLSETSRFARERPGLFLALAAVGGLLAGRLTRGLAADSRAQSPNREAATHRPDSLGSDVNLEPGPSSPVLAGGTADTGDYATPGLGTQNLQVTSTGDGAWYDDEVGSTGELARGNETEVGREAR
jgi:hypothetical protein